MLKLTVEGMTCGHCVKSVTAAIQRVEPGVFIQVELADKSVSINSAGKFATRFAEAITDAGYRVTDGATAKNSTPACRCCA